MAQLVLSQKLFMFICHVGVSGRENGRNLSWPPEQKQFNSKVVKLKTTQTKRLTVLLKYKCKSESNKWCRGLLAKQKSLFFFLTCPPKVPQSRSRGGHQLQRDSLKKGGRSTHHHLSCKQEGPPVKCNNSELGPKLSDSENDVETKSIFVPFYSGGQVLGFEKMRPS